MLVVKGLTSPGVFRGIFFVLSLETSTLILANMSLKLSGWNDTIVALATPPGIGAIGIKAIKGDFYNVMGLPISRLVKELHLHEQTKK